MLSPIVSNKVHLVKCIAFFDYIFSSNIRNLCRTVKLGYNEFGYNELGYNEQIF